ncbi:ATP-binding cassette domain-containing protein [Cryptosporangium phraense]|uniref:ATP-binding cassette domain-containing protein n=1 Tax=Cryptosporangium phraense TaxID=2593070 RepID=A0A545AYH1_9ACTN|nr:ATP-binding cassette domain-containing protein [Cryptosporangium phraense]TQS46384.1 ATP-binding cassette domain-containing protein [Cryptosporangium phraense]
MLELRNVSKRYRRTTAVEALTCTIRPGQVTGFLGPNGAGKSTTLRMILGLDRPSAGEVRIDGERYADLRHPLRHVGALLEGPAAHGGRSAHAHLRWLAQSNRIPAARVDEVLGLVGLDDVARRRIGTYSLGMTQRLGIAAALLGDPPILIFDEPTNGLDPEAIRWFRTTARDAAADGRTVLVSSHLMSEMALTADHLLVLSRGRLLADTPLDEFVGDGSLEDAFLRLVS